MEISDQIKEIASIAAWKYWAVFVLSSWIELRYVWFDFPDRSKYYVEVEVDLYWIFW